MRKLVLALLFLATPALALDGFNEAIKCGGAFTCAGPEATSTPGLQNNCANIGDLTTSNGGLSLNCYLGADCINPDEFITGVNADGTVVCATPVASAAFNTPTPQPTATPQPAATPQPTATPLNFGTAGNIPVFGSPELQTFAGATCPTPQVAQAISSDGSLTCTTPGGSSCPAGSDRDVQYKLTGACAGDAGFIYNYDNPSIQILADNSAPRSNSAAVTVKSTSNTAGADVVLQLILAGTSGDSAFLDFDRGVATGGVNRWITVGLNASNGDFNFIDSDGSTVTAGTPIMQFIRASGSQEILFAPGDGTTTVPSLGVVNDAGTGFSKTSTGGGESRLNYIVQNRNIAQGERTASTRTRFGINDATLWYGEQTDSISGAGPVEITPGKTLDVVTTSTGAGSAIYPGDTDIVEGQYVIIMNGGNNDLTIDTCNTASPACHVKTTGAATQTLANQYDTISFINVGGFWIQYTPVQGP